MKDFERNKLNMFVMVDEFALASVTITNKIVIFAALYQVFKDYVTEIFAVSEEQEKDQRGVTKTKQAVRVALIAQLEKITRKCVGYASGVDDLVLLQMVRIASSQLKAMADADLVKKAESLVTALTPRLPDLAGYNVVASDLDLLTSLKNDFKSIYTAPVGNRQTKKQLTEQLSALFSKADAQLGKMDDQVGTLFDTDPTFHDEYFKKRKIVQLAKRMRAFQMWITDEVTGLPVEKARVKIIKKDGSDMTKAAQSVGSDLAKNVKVAGAGGGVVNNNMEPGEYYYEVSLGGYVTGTGSFFVNDGLMTEEKVRLVKSE